MYACPIESDGPSLAEYVDHQEVCASVIFQCFLDAGSHHRNDVIGAAAFVNSDRFEMFLDLAGVSEPAGERVRAEILRRANSSLQKIDAYRQRRRELRAG